MRVLLILISCALFSFQSNASQSLSEAIDLPGTEWRGKRQQPILNRLVEHSGQKPFRLTVHYTGVKKNPKRDLAFKLRGVFDYSTLKIEGAKKRLWGDMPYHFYIDMTGAAGEGRNTAFQPDTNTRYETDGHLTIVVEGDDTDVLSDRQKSKLYALLEGLQKKFQIPVGRIGIHKHFANTKCPGNSIEQAVAEYVKLHATKEVEPVGPVDPR